MSDTPVLPTHIPNLQPSPSPSPRRGQAGHSSPRLPRTTMPSRLPSFSATQPLDFSMPESPPGTSRTNVVLGFSPTYTSQVLPAVMEGDASGSPRPQQLQLGPSHHRRLSSLSPQLTTPVDQTFQFGYAHADPSPRPLASSPRAAVLQDLPPRSRRNSAAIVSISLSSRSRSRTPRGSAAPLPGQLSGQGTPSKGSQTVTPRGDEHGAGKEVMIDMAAPWSPGAEDMDDWQPAGGILLDGGEDDIGLIDDSMDLDEDEEGGRTWTGLSDASPPVEDVLTPGTIIGEGLLFQGEVIVPAVRKMISEGGDELGMPLRRGGSEVSKAVRGEDATAKKRYEVVRRLGTGSYAVVYLVKERGGRKREYALKCLSKQDLEEEQLETQLFEAMIHLSLPIHQNVVTLYQTWQTKKWLFLMLELCPGEDLFYWLEKSRDASPQAAPTPLPEEHHHVMSSSKLSSSSIPFSSSQMFTNLNQISSSFSNSPSNAFSPHSHFSGSPASLLFAHHNGHHHAQHLTSSHTPPTPSLLSAFSANTLLSQRRLRLIASMFSQMCEAVAVCHEAGVSHRDIKPENFICCDSVELEAAQDGEYGEDGDDGGKVDFGPQAKRKVVVKLTDFGLATTEEESGDVECGSKPYMSYECRNNLGPTYLPGPADVWSLGIVLINMLFHRNPWKDPTPGDPNFDNFLSDPIGFLLTKFTGIGREVASYLANHVLCVDVDARVTAQDFGKWIKSLPDMIGGRKALHALKLSRLETVKQQPLNQGTFIKSPVDTAQERGRKPATSGLTSSAPAPALSSLPHPSSLAQSETAEQVESDCVNQTLPTPDLEYDEMVSATTVDEQPTPVDGSEMPSPEQIDGDETTRSLSNTKRRKRGLRKGKGAQAAAAAAASASGHVSPEERDALLAELASASQSLAREMSKMHKSENEFDATRVEEFPPLGTTPAQAAAAKKSKWRDMMKLSQGNPELAALARRVAERDGDESFKMSAPAKLQHQGSKGQLAYKPPFRQTTTASSGISSALSSFGPVSSATSSSGGVDDDWRKPRVVPDDRERGRAHGRAAGAGRDEERSRARKAAIAAAAITGNMEPMGAFGKPSHLAHASRQTNYAIRSSAPISENTNLNTNTFPQAPYKSGLAQAKPVAVVMHQKEKEKEKEKETDPTTIYTRPTLSSAESNTTVKSALAPLPPLSASTTSTTSAGTITTEPSASTGTATNSGPAPAGQPNKHKLKGQMNTLAKMLSGLKTKGKD